MDDLLAEFVTETAESLVELDSALLQLEQTPDDQATISQVFRLVHTIKGTCGFLGLSRLEHLAHAAENVLGNLRDGSLRANADIISAILRGIDGLKTILDGLAQAGHEPDGQDADLIALLNGIAAGPGAATETQAVAADAPDATADATPTVHAPAVHAPAVHTEAPHPPAPHPEAAPARAAATTPAGASLPAAPPAKDDHADSDTAHPVGPQTIRVNVEVLEELMTLVGELVLTRNQLLQIDRTEHNAAYVVPLQRLSHITTDLQEGVMKTRMQPIGTAWNKLPRIVRDLSHELGKQIELVMHGATTELDRQVLELIRDPLTHMVRNSADHGLESPAERRAANKPETGHITLNAYHEGGHIIIEVGDDGRGLPVEKIRARARAKALASEAELAAMTDADIQRFIFHPGFSTAAVVTAVSGRGVGMDVVKTNVEKIGGTIDLRSVAGSGSLFIIKIPLTLAIVSALIIAVGGERFAVPQISVVELVRLRPEGEAPSHPGEPTIGHIDDTKVLRLRDQLLPLVNLAEVLRLPAATRAADEGLHIVIAQVGTNMLGLIVDQVYDTEEIVVKPVAPILRHLTLFSGNTILGDGSVIMILDTNGIARLLGVGSSGLTEQRPAPVVPGTQSSNDRTAMLLFRAGANRCMAVPLGLVARLEDIAAAQIERIGGQLLTQYRGKLMPLIPFEPAETAPHTDAGRDAPSRPVLVFSDAGHSVGLIVEEIIDVVEEQLNIEMIADRPGVLGIAVIAGRATDVIDTGHWLTKAYHDWFGHKAATRKAGMRILVIDDNDFFRQLLVPYLSASGYHVTAAAGGPQALQLRDAGEMFDLIISDVEMPVMDGLEFARTVRLGGAWAALPLIALTGGKIADDGRAARDAGFTEVYRKLDRDSLLACLRSRLNQLPALAA